MSHETVEITSPDGTTTAQVLASSVAVYERHGWTRGDAPARDDSAATLNPTTEE